MATTLEVNTPPLSHRGNGPLGELDLDESVRGFTDCFDLQQVGKHLLFAWGIESLIA